MRSLEPSHRDQIGQISGPRFVTLALYVTAIGHCRQWCLAVSVKVER